ncbi:snare protein syntaxin-like protein 18/UFE1, partial [Aureobasidium melanogenum]
LRCCLCRLQFRDRPCLNQCRGGKRPSNQTRDLQVPEAQCLLRKMMPSLLRNRLSARWTGCRIVLMCLVPRQQPRDPHVLVLTRRSEARSVRLIPFGFNPLSDQTPSMQRMTRSQNIKSHTTRKAQNAHVLWKRILALLGRSLARFSSLLPLPTFSVVKKESCTSCSMCSFCSVRLVTRVDCNSEISMRDLSAVLFSRLAGASQNQKSSSAHRTWSRVSCCICSSLNCGSALSCSCVADVSESKAASKLVPASLSLACRNQTILSRALCSDSSASRPSSNGSKTALIAFAQCDMRCAACSCRSTVFASASIEALSVSDRCRCVASCVDFWSAEFCRCGRRVRSAMRAFYKQVRHRICLTQILLTYDAVCFFQKLVQSVNRRCVECCRDVGHDDLVFVDTDVDSLSQTDVSIASPSSASTSIDVICFFCSAFLTGVTPKIPKGDVGQRQGSPYHRSPLYINTDFTPRKPAARHYPIGVDRHRGHVICRSF